MKWLNEKTLQLDREQLIVLAVLIGTDYNREGIPGIGPKKSNAWIWVLVILTILLAIAGYGMFKSILTIQDLPTYTPEANTATPTVTPANPATPPTVAQPSPVAQMVSPVFNRSLALGMRHPDVKRLQQVLNSDPDTQIASTGPGSPGNETEFFGPATVKAVKRFQAKHGLEPDGLSGYFRHFDEILRTYDPFHPVRLRYIILNSAMRRVSL